MTTDSSYRIFPKTLSLLRHRAVEFRLIAFLRLDVFSHCLVRVRRVIFPASGILPWFQIPLDVDSKSRLTRLAVIFLIRLHIYCARYSVGHVEESGDVSDVPNIFVRELNIA